MPRYMGAKGKESGPIKHGLRRGYHSITVAGTRFDISQRYEFIKSMGYGAYGVVMYVQDNASSIFMEYL